MSLKTMFVDGDLWDQKMFCQHMYTSFLQSGMINHNGPFPRSFRAGVEKE